MYICQTIHVYFQNMEDKPKLNMKNVTIASFLAILFLTNCKTSQTVTDKDVSSVSNHFNSLPIKYGIKPETFKVNE
jgi:uncharacterized Fe-S center protein